MARVSKAPATKRRHVSGAVRKLRSTLKAIAEASPALSFAEGEKYVCTVCDLPLKLCLADPTRRCATMILEGTELQLLRRVVRELSRCIGCGAQIPKSVLRRNPLAELCPSCQQSSRKSKPPQRSKGVSS